jgi:hypothetical protein
MMDEKPILCQAKNAQDQVCGTEVFPGTLYCWHHEVSPPKVGALSADHGQLRWYSTDACGKEQHERLLAVILEGVQVFVRSVEENRSARPPRLDLEVSDPLRTTSKIDVYVQLPRLIDRLLAGDEEIEAKQQEAI